MPIVDEGCSQYDPNGGPYFSQGNVVWPQSWVRLVLGPGSQQADDRCPTTASSRCCRRRPGRLRLAPDPPLKHASAAKVAPSNADAPSEGRVGEIRATVKHRPVKPYGAQKACVVKERLAFKSGAIAGSRLPARPGQDLARGTAAGCRRNQRPATQNSRLGPTGRPDHRRPVASRRAFGLSCVCQRVHRLDGSPNAHIGTGGGGWQR